MLSAFQHHINELRKELAEHGRRIDELQKAGQSGDLAQTTAEPTQTQAIKQDPKCSSALDNLQAQLKKNTFRINDLQQKWRDHDADLSQLKEGAMGLPNLPYPQGTTNTSWHNMVQGHHYQPGQPADIRQTFSNGAWASPNGQGVFPDLNGPASVTFNPMGNGRFGDISQISNMDRHGSHQTTQTNDVIGAKVTSEIRKTGELAKPDTPRDTEMMMMKEELSLCKIRVGDLEAQLHSRDRVIRDMMEGQEELHKKEREYIHKQEWYEHKMRLLKQDKRRRGETIGKLLRCIDDMRDTGRLDESRVTEGRYVLNATLASRGMPTEDRIRAAVEALEQERTDRSPRNRLDSTGSIESGVVDGSHRMATPSPAPPNQMIHLGRPGFLPVTQPQHE